MKYDNIFPILTFRENTHTSVNLSLLLLGPPNITILKFWSMLKHSSNLSDNIPKIAIWNFLEHNIYWIIYIDALFPVPHPPILKIVKNYSSKIWNHCPTFLKLRKYHYFIWSKEYPTTFDSSTLKGKDFNNSFSPKLCNPFHLFVQTSHNLINCQIFKKKAPYTS